MTVYTVTLLHTHTQHQLWVNLLTFLNNGVLRPLEGVELRLPCDGCDDCLDGLLTLTL